MYQIYSVLTFTTHAKYLIAGTLQTSYLHFAWLHNHVFPFYIEPLKLIGEGKYNLNAIKVIKVTESFLGLDRSHKDCQSTEELDECTTRQFLDAYLDNCGCLPLSIWIKENVFIFKSYHKSYSVLFLHYCRSPSVVQSICAAFRTLLPLWILHFAFAAAMAWWWPAIPKQSWKEAWKNSVRRMSELTGNTKGGFTKRTVME